MKLIKQIKLYFKEGNSDKVYEVDLCDVGSEQYVVNFRFGRRGATLKEGTKTPKPVALLAAENYFNSLEVEKRKKGYQSEDEVFRPMPTGIVDDSKPQTREAAILKRLSALASGQTAFLTAWKPSRVIWRAGQLRLIESVPFLIRLVDRGDEMQRYAALWSLGRCADPQAARTLQVYFSNQKYADKIRRVAGEALLHVLKDDELWAHTQRIESRLPPSVQQALAEPDAATLIALLADSVQNQSQPDYSMLEDLYTLTLNKPIIRAPLLNVLRTIPLKPGWFRHVRHILKMAELRDDFEVQGLLAYRFERTTSFFRKPAYYHYDEDSNDPSIYIAALGQRVRIRAELRKPESRLAYSNRTRSYLRKRLFRTLIQFGKQKSVDYVRLATAILLSYDKATDYRPPHSEITYKWDQAQQRSILYTRQYPAYNNAYLLNWILYGGNDKLEIDYMGLWHYRELVPYDTQVQLDAQQAVKPMEGGLFASLLSRFSQLLGKQATDTTSEHADTPAPSVRDEYFPELWDQMPQAYVQLLLRARVDEVHAFAYQNLCQHAAYPAIDEKIDDQLLRQLLTSTFEIPARWGVELLRKRLPHGADRSLVLLLLNSPFADVRKLGQEWIEQNSQPFVDDSGFVVAMLFSPHDELRRWMNRLLANVTLTATQQQVLIGRAVARLHTLTDNTAETNALIGDATQSLLRYTADALPLLSQQVVAELLQLPVASIQAFAVRLLILKNSQPSASVLGALLTSAYADVRLAGQQLYAGMVSGLTTDATYADELTELLVHALIRKEVAEGIHDELAMVLRGPLVTSVAKLDRATTLRLVYAHFRPAQELGLFMLDRYQNPHDLTIRQIIALGNHELLAIRQWCWNYFRQNVARIRYERDEAIRLLDATWEDTRQAAMAFFRHAFTETDWTPETLIGIADSVRPDVQAFGRELITHFFTDADGPEFLLKLSQHPAAAVQVFTTNYLERYATDQPDRLKALAFYFRSVLLRVHQSRTAKTRVFAFLRQEGLKSEDNARFVARILTDVSATAAIGDKASCIQIMRDLQQQFNELPLPIRQHQLEIR